MFIDEHVRLTEEFAADESLNGLRLRLATDDDAQDLFGLLALCFAEYPGCYVDPHGDLVDLLNPVSAMAERGGIFWGIEDGRSRICACISLDFPHPDYAEMHRLYVRPDMRRRRLGELLVQLAEKAAQARGVRDIGLWSDTRFKIAHSFYERLKYRRAEATRELGDISNSSEEHFRKSMVYQAEV